MSRARQRRREQGHVEGGSHGVYGIRGYEESLFAYFGQDEGLCPRLHGFRVWIQPDDHNDDFSYLLVDEDCMFEFLRNICPRLKERRDLQDEKEKWLREKRDLRDEKEELQATLQASESSGIARGLSVELLRREVAEATAEIERLAAINAELQKDISEAKQDINKAHQDANEAIEEASSTKQRLEETESAFAEEKQKYISAPDLVPCLQSLADEVCVNRGLKSIRQRHIGLTCTSYGLVVRVCLAICVKTAQKHSSKPDRQLRGGWSGREQFQRALHMRRLYLAS